MALCTRHLRCCGHVSYLNILISMDIPSSRGHEKPKKTWSGCIRANMRIVALIHRTEAWTFGVGKSGHLLTALILGHRNVPHITVYQTCSQGSTLLNRAKI